MALAHDSRGFLVGEPIDLGRLPTYLREIKNDITAIKSAVIAGNVGAEKRAAKSGVGAAHVVTPRRNTIATPKQRDSAGRFVASVSRNTSKPVSQPAAKEATASVSALASRLSRLASVGDGASDADPSIKAFKEVAEPMRRGLEFFGGGGDKKTGFLRKILGTLNVFRKEETTFNKAANKSLKKIEERPVIDGDGGFNGGITGSLIGRFVPWVLGGLATAGAGIASVAGGALSTAIATIFSPVGAVVAAAGVAAWGVFTDDGRKFFADLGDKMVDSWGNFTDWLIESSPKTMAFLGKAGAKVEIAKEVVAEQVKGAGTYLVKSSPKTMAAIGKAWSGAKQIGGNALKSISSFVGSIPGLSDAQASAYAADVQRTESGGNHRAENSLGYIGKYQFGADTLADTGLVDLARLKAVKKAGRFSQKAFLNDPSNWTIEGGKEAFLSNPALQDKAFADMQQRNYAAGLRSGAIRKDSSPDRVAAYLKSAHLAGAGGANDYFLRGIDRSDGSTWVSQYARQAAAAVSVPTPSAPKMPTVPAIAEAPQVIQPLGTPKTPEITVNMPSQDVGQSLPDARIAHIASGGIGWNR